MVVSVPVLTRARPSFASKSEWTADVRVNLLSGLVVAVALIPEAIAFSVIAGVDPRVGLFASFSLAVSIAFTGGRPGMITAATGAMALVIVPLVRDHGVAYLFAATVLTGLLQLACGVLGVGRLMRFVPRGVMVGFVNALAILIFKAQLEHVIGKSWIVYAMVAGGVAMIYLFPKVTRALPAPLIAIAVITAIAVFGHIDVPTVGDMGDLPSTLPWFGIPSVPFSYETFTIIFPYAITLTLVGLLESLLTAQLVDDLTDTNSDKDRESRGQGIGNVITGFLGGMAGCAMIGQSMINVKSGGRTRLSTLSAGVFLLFMILVLGSVVEVIPMGALVAVMVVVAVSTFDWSSIDPAHLRRSPRSETAVTVLVVGIVVFTHNLAIGVIAGVLLSAVFFARKVAHLVDVTSVSHPDDQTTVYTLTGALFFASTNELIHTFDYTDPHRRVVIDLADAHVWDASAVAALDAIVERFARHGITAEIIGLNVPSEAFHTRLSGTLTAGH
ncbi:MAG: SulP family inorganic anion transporter [Acidimicrobiia bacterium]